MTVRLQCLGRRCGIARGEARSYQRTQSAQFDDHVHLTAPRSSKWKVRVRETYIATPESAP